MAANINKKVTLRTLESEAAHPEYLGKLDVGGASTLEALRFLLESNDVLEWAFEFWDVEDRRRVRRKAKLVLKAFDTNMVVFTKSWRFEFEVPQKLRMIPPSELGVVELHQLRITLLNGWQVEIQVRKGDGQANLPNI